MDEYTKPSAKNPFFYRVGQKVDDVAVNRVYLLGLECVPVEDVEIAIKTTLNPKDICDLDENIPLPDELIQDLIMQVLQLGKYIMMMPKENTNEGEDDSSPDTRMYANRAVNLPETQTQQQ
jgi:hypothetical protein